MGAGWNSRPAPAIMVTDEGETDVPATAQRASLRRLAKEQLPGLYAFARHLVGRDGADDLVQETLLRACRSFDTLEDPQAAPKWLRVIMANAWRDGLRRAGRRPVEVSVESEEEFSLYRRLVEVDPFPYSDTMHVDFLGSLSREDVHEVLAQISERYRIPLVMYHLQGFSTAEIAELLELPAGTVYSHLHRGRQRFERAMWDHAEAIGLVADSATAAEKGAPA